MSASDPGLRVIETANEFRVQFSGVLGLHAVGQFTALARCLRGAAQPKSVKLDLLDGATIEATGLPGLLALEHAVGELGVGLEVRARGDQAAETLARAGLARVLYSGP